MAAVLATEKGLWFTDCAPDHRILEQFQIRGDNQIASLEMLAIAYGLHFSLSVLCMWSVNNRFLAGLSTFANDLRGLRVIVHSDNTVAEHGMRKGRARAFDHTAVIHSVWCAEVCSRVL